MKLVIATATVVKKTNVMASAEISRIDALNSCQDVLDAASYKSGGSKMIKITYGSICRFGNWGTKPMINSAATIGSVRVRSFANKGRQTDQDRHDKNDNFEIFHTG